MGRAGAGLWRVSGFGLVLPRAFAALRAEQARWPAVSRLGAAERASESEYWTVPKARMGDSWSASRPEQLQRMIRMAGWGPQRDDAASWGAGSGWSELGRAGRQRPEKALKRGL